MRKLNDLSPDRVRRIFVDANIFFAAVASHTGGSYFLIELGEKKIVQLVSVVHVPSRLELKVGTLVPEKDAPIIMGAFLSGADALITLDKKHFLDNAHLLKINLPFLIMTPGDFIQKFIL